ncbi:MAG TPA: thiamine pyrophosphate-binding protein [Elusimicrobiota bacterium]|nr:thiamine pyrophosphate-binding protein [Elusimicrobiota bacterium]
MNIGDVIVKTLEDIGVDTIFGGSGQSDSDILFALEKSKKIKTVIIRNEQAASFMACGYAMFSNKLGVCFSTAGPGVINLFSGVAVALSDSLPILCISPYAPKEYRGKGDLGETTGLHRTPDTQAMFRATTKGAFMIERPEQTCDILEEAINLAFEGRPGPVNLHVDYNIMKVEVPNVRPIKLEIRPVLPLAKNVEQFADALAGLLEKKKKVVALLGYGCVRSGAEKELLAFVEKFQIPFMTTMDGKGMLPEDHPLHLGMTGISGDLGAKRAFKEADAVIAIGNSFAKWSTWMFNKDLFADKLLFRINIDPHEISRYYQADYYMVSDVKPAIQKLNESLGRRVSRVEKAAMPVEKKFADEKIDHKGPKIHPGQLVQEISKHLPEKSIILGDAGAHMLWLAAYLKLTKGQNYQNPGSFGPMAVNVNSSIGIKCAVPERTVVAAVGDGDYQMAGFELMTAVENKIPVVWVIFNNNEFNIIKMFQLRIRKAEVFNRFLNPNFKAYAEACGALGFRVEKIEDFAPAFQKALASGKPALIDVVVEPDIYPPFNPYNEPAKP